MQLNIAQKILSHNKTVYNQVSGDFSLTRNYIWPEFEYFKGYLQKGQDVLDIGCGNGRILQLLKDYKPNYLGVDNSENLIEEAEKSWSGYNFMAADVLDLSVVGRKFDLVFLISTLHHIPSQELREQALQNIKSVLKPDGKLLMINWNLWQKRYIKYIIKYILLKITDPSKEIIEDVKAKDLDLQDIFMQFFDKKNKRYIHAFTEFNISNLLKLTGFEIIKNVSNKRNIITVAKIK